MYFYVSIIVYYIYGLCYFSYITLNAKKKTIYNLITEPNDIV